PGRPESHPGRLQHCYPKALLQQEQRGRDARVARSDHADVGFMGTLQGRTLRGGTGRGGVIGMWIACVTHVTHLVRYFLHCMHATASQTSAPVGEPGADPAGEGRAGVMSAAAGRGGADVPPLPEGEVPAPPSGSVQCAALGSALVMMMHSMEKPSMMAIA